MNLVEGEKIKLNSELVELYNQIRELEQSNR